jgi:hypothetical protein
MRLGGFDRLGWGSVLAHSANSLPPIPAARESRTDLRKHVTAIFFVEVAYDELPPGIPYEYAQQETGKCRWVDRHLRHTPDAEGC